MKTLKTITIIAFAFIAFNNSIIAQITITNGSSYNVCQGVETHFHLPLQANAMIEVGYWKFGNNDNDTGKTSFPFSYFGYTINSMATTTNYNCSDGYPCYTDLYITANTSTALGIIIVQGDCSTGSYPATTFTIVPYYTGIIGGSSNFCETSQETYTCNTNQSGIGANAYTWTLPSFLSGSSTTDQITVTPTGTGTGNISVSFTGGCSGNSSSASEGIESYPTSLTAPGGTLVYEDYNSTCYYNANIPSLTGAEYYEWGKNSSFTETYCANTTSPTTTGGPFYELTNYTIYVRGINPCTTGPSHSWTKETPQAPGNCIQIVMADALTQGNQTDYNVYPNPASGEITIEYPSTADDSPLNFTIYNMVGEKIANWILPASGNSVTENASSLISGVYLYEINSANGMDAHGKLVIKR